MTAQPLSVTYRVIDDGAYAPYGRYAVIRRTRHKNGATEEDLGMFPSRRMALFFRRQLEDHTDHRGKLRT
jgi:hypothetical protein